MERTIEYQDSSPLLDEKEALRAKMDEDGFAFFRGLVPRQEVLELRRLILQIYDERGWIAAGTELMEGVVDRSINEAESFASNGADKATYQAVYRLLPFHRLAHHPAILDAFEKLFGETVFVHPRNIARLMAPHKDAVATPPHQDFIYVQGSKATYTCWLPLGDCPLELGGLSVLRGTHKLDILPVTSAEGAGNRTVILDSEDRQWAQGDLQAGDAVIFHSHTVHRSLPNQTEDRIRLSSDYRYQPLSLPVEEKQLEPHGNMMTWDEAYAGWEGDDLKYYWRGLDLEVLDFDWSMLETRDG